MAQVVLTTLFHEIFRILVLQLNYGVFTLHETENENDTDAENDRNGFHCNMQNTSHCTDTDNNNDLFNDMNGFQGHFFA